MFILTQIVGIIITCHVLIVWIINRKLDSFTDRIFIFTIIETLCSQILDIMCQIFMSKVYFDIGDFWTIAVLKLYLISIPLYIVDIAFYSSRIIFKDEKYNKALILLTIYIFINIIVVCLLPASYIYEQRCSLPVGPAVTYTYIITLISCIFLAAELVFFKKEIDKYAFYAALSWIGTFLLGGLAQFISINTIHIPIVSLMLGIGIFVLYIIIENPGNKFDYNSNVYHFETFVDYINEIIDNKDIQSVLYVSLFEINGKNGTYEKKFFEKLIMLFENDYSVKAFSGYTNELIITTKLFVNIQLVADKVCDCIFEVEKENPKVNLKSSIVLFPDVNNHIDSYMVLRSIFNDYQANSRLPEKINVVTIDNDIYKQYNNEIKQVNDIDDAIKNGRFNIGYQIIHNNNNFNSIYVETNVELSTKDGLVIDYSNYNYIINKFRKYIQMDIIAFEKICNVLKNLNRENIVYFLVHISTQALEDKSIIDKYISIINEINVDTSKICFELTNVNAITNKEALLSNIESLISKGFIFAIGGFGSGESNLNYFIDLPAKIIKLDRSVLKNALESDNAFMIMDSITRLAHSLNFKVIAVGIENDQSKECAEKCNVDMMLGNYYHNVIDENSFIQTMHKGELIC